jgi:hypothetical protein
VAAAGMANPRVQEVLQAMGFPTINMAMARFAREPGLAQETLTHLSARSGRQNPRLQHLAREDIAETVRFVIAAQGYSYLDATQPERVGQVPSHSMTAVTQACSRPDMLVASPVYSNDKEARDLVERLPQILDTKSAAMHIARVRQRRAQQLGQFAQIVGDRIFLQLYEAKFTLDASKCAAGGNSETDRDIVSDVAFTSFTVMNALNVWACNSCSPQHAITQFGPALLHDRGCVLVQCDMPIVDNSMGRKEPLFGLDPALVRRGSFSYKVMPLDPHTVALALGNTDLRILQRIAAIQEAENRVIPDDELFLAA